MNITYLNTIIANEVNSNIESREIAFFPSLFSYTIIITFFANILSERIRKGDRILLNIQFDKCLLPFGLFALHRTA